MVLPAIGGSSKLNSISCVHNCPVEQFISLLQKLLERHSAYEVKIELGAYGAQTLLLGQLAFSKTCNLSDSHVCCAL